jgi:hypothetical protein
MGYPPWRSSETFALTYEFQGSEVQKQDIRFRFEKPTGLGLLTFKGSCSQEDPAVIRKLLGKMPKAQEVQGKQSQG